MQVFGKVCLTLPANKVVETDFFETKLTGTLAKYRFTELFLAQTCLQVAQAYTIPHFVDVVVGICRAVAFIQRFGIDE